jgi:hypothetical protein
VRDQEEKEEEDEAGERGVFPLERRIERCHEPQRTKFDRWECDGAVPRTRKNAGGARKRQNRRSRRKLTVTLVVLLATPLSPSPLIETPLAVGARVQRTLTASSFPLFPLFPSDNSFSFILFSRSSNSTRVAPCSSTFSHSRTLPPPHPHGEPPADRRPCPEEKADISATSRATPTSFTTACGSTRGLWRTLGMFIVQLQPHRRPTEHLLPFSPLSLPFFPDSNAHHSLSYFNSLITA